MIAHLLVLILIVLGQNKIDASIINATPCPIEKSVPNIISTHMETISPMVTRATVINPISTAVAPINSAAFFNLEHVLRRFFVLDRFNFFCFVDSENPDVEVEFLSEVTQVFELL